VSRGRRRSAARTRAGRPRTGLVTRSATACSRFSRRRLSCCAGRASATP